MKYENYRHVYTCEDCKHCKEYNPDDINISLYCDGKTDNPAEYPEVKAKDNICENFVLVSCFFKNQPLCSHCRNLEVSEDYVECEYGLREYGEGCEHLDYSVDIDVWIN